MRCSDARTAFAKQPVVRRVISERGTQTDGCPSANQVRWAVPLKLVYLVWRTQQPTLASANARHIVLTDSSGLPFVWYFLSNRWLRCCVSFRSPFRALRCYSCPCSHLPSAFTSEWLLVPQWSRSLHKQWFVWTPRRCLLRPIQLTDRRHSLLIAAYCRFCSLCPVSCNSLLLRWVTSHLYLICYRDVYELTEPRRCGTQEHRQSLCFLCGNWTFHWARNAQYASRNIALIISRAYMSTSACVRQRSCFTRLYRGASAGLWPRRRVPEPRSHDKAVARYHIRMRCSCTRKLPSGERYGHRSDMIYTRLWLAHFSDTFAKTISWGKHTNSWGNGESRL